MLPQTASLPLASFPSSSLPPPVFQLEFISWRSILFGSVAEQHGRRAVRNVWGLGVFGSPL